MKTGAEKNMCKRIYGAYRRFILLLLVAAAILMTGIFENVSAAETRNSFSSEKEYVDMIGPIARSVGLKYDYLPSVLAAQCILETGYGAYADSTTKPMIRYNNHLGMKTSMINSTWAEYTVWPGRSFTKRTPEWYGGRNVYIRDRFRKYDSVKQCLTDYVMFMTHAKLGSGRYKYRYDVIGNPSFRKTIRAVRVNGYCTDPVYDKSVIRIIRKWNLTRLDSGFGIRVSDIRLSRRKTLRLKKGKTYLLKAHVLPSNAARKGVKWKSSDPLIASVRKGIVTAKQKGTVRITAVSADKPEISKSVKVVVR